MTFVKFTFVLLLLVPVAILMWNIISHLIGNFAGLVKENPEQGRVKEKVLRNAETKKAIDHEKYGERYRGSHIGYSGNEAANESEQDNKHKDTSSLKQMMEKRKRRKERRKKKEKEQ